MVASGAESARAISGYLEGRQGFIQKPTIPRASYLDTLRSCFPMAFDASLGHWCGPACNREFRTVVRNAPLRNEHWRLFSFVASILRRDISELSRLDAFKPCTQRLAHYAASCRDCTFGCFRCVARANS